MNSLRLISAITYITVHILNKDLNSFVSAIQFEDGSGYKFNYQTNGSSHWKFIDLTGKI